jgi:transcriptional regulator with XRE-family HTH domain
MTGKELAYLLEKTGISGKQFAEAMGISPSGVTIFKSTKILRDKSEARIIEAFDRLGIHGSTINLLIGQRFEESKAQPPTPTSDRQTNALIRLSDLQYQNNQLKRHIEALELNVKLLTEKYESVLNYSLNT